MLERISVLLASISTDSAPFPPTLLYNEGWLLRIIVDWFSRNQLSAHPLNFDAGSRWFSEALIPSAFHARYRGDPLAEARTHLDGAIGHFVIGNKGKADLTLQSGATQLIALEAKISSKLSGKTSNVGYFDQAARNVACIAEVLQRANWPPSNMEHLGFYVVAPLSQIRLGIFTKEIDPGTIDQKVWKRVQEYGGDKDGWYTNYFVPLLKNIVIGTLSWEDVIDSINIRDQISAESIGKFYQQCLLYNRK